MMSAGSFPKSLSILSTHHPRVCTGLVGLTIAILVISVVPYDHVAALPPPGDMDYQKVIAEKVWSSGVSTGAQGGRNEEVSTDIVSGDVDRDGHVDLVFGTDDGSIVAVDVMAKMEIIRTALLDNPIDHIVIVNVGKDKAMEIVASSGNKLFCVDGLDGKVQWNLTSHEEWGETGSIDGLTVSCEDGNRTGDLFFFTKRDGGIEGSIDKVMLTRVDCEGKEMYSISLPKHGDYLGREFSMVFFRITPFDSLWGIASDRGSHDYAEGVGHNIWIFDTTNGDVLDFEEYPSHLFRSPPAIAEFGGHCYLLIGLAENPVEPDGLMIFDLSIGTISFYPIYPQDAGYIDWRHVALVQTSDDLRISLTASTTIQAVWSFNQGRTIWTYNSSGFYDAPYPPNVHDIDSDSQAEIILSLGYPLILNASTGAVEFDGDGMIPGTRAGGRIAIDDFDGDGRSEICAGSVHLN
jgi:hypothetical protein